MKKILAVLTAGIAVAIFTGCSVSSNTPSPQGSPSPNPAESPQQSSASQALRGAGDASLSGTNSITVNSSEKVTVVPDIAQIEYAVRTEAANAAACQQKNTEAVSQVIALLTAQSIDETSIQTSDYYMNPVYNYSGNTPRVTGYEAITTLTVSDLPIDRLDEILSESVSGGINSIRSITYQASHYDESYQEALTAAVACARKKAEVLAAAAGCSVGRILNITETSGYSQARYSDQALVNKLRSSAEKEELAGAVADSAGIMPGEIQVEASIIAEYQIY